MRAVLAGFLFLAGCAAPRDPFAYEPPEKTPYDHRPVLKEQYLRAHRAAWNVSVGGFAEERLGGPAASTTTCCEATRNVTSGWYAGQADARRFTERISDASEEVFRRLKKDIEAHPVVDWYVSDSYTPSELVEVPEQDGRVVRCYRDATRSKLHEVRQVRDGKNHGKVESYDANGVLHEVSTWVDGVREGEATVYSDTGMVVSKSVYRQGKVHGRERWFEETGELKMYQEYVDGVADGLQLTWKEDGTLSQFQRWNSGQRHGRCLYYLFDGAHVDVYDAGQKVRSESRIPLDRLPEDDRPSTYDRVRKSFSR